MSLTDNNNGMVMPVSPMYGGGNAGFGGYGGYGDGLFWIIILFLFAAMSGGWGNGFGAGNGGAVLPFMMNQAGQRALANEIEQYVLPTPRPAYVVQNPNCCGQQTFGCGCGAM